MSISLVLCGAITVRKYNSMETETITYEPGQLVKIKEYSHWYRTADLINYEKNSSVQTFPAIVLIEEAIGMLLKYIGYKGRSSVQQSADYWEVLVNGMIYDISIHGFKPLLEENQSLL